MTNSAPRWSRDARHRVGRNRRGGVQAASGRCRGAHRGGRHHGLHQGSQEEQQPLPGGHWRTLGLRSWRRLLPARWHLLPGHWMHTYQSGIYIYTINKQYTSTHIVQQVLLTARHFFFHRQVATFSLIDVDWVRSMLYPVAVAAPVALPIPEQQQQQQQPNPLVPLVPAHLHPNGQVCECQQSHLQPGLNQYLPPVNIFK